MKKVILINDCKFQSIIMKDMLNDLGYEVNLTNEYGALAKIKKFNPDIVICNLIMKNITGEKLIKSIKDINKNIICILSSANEIRLEDYSKDYINEVIHVPVEKEKLETILEEILNKLDSPNNLQNSNDVGFSFCPYCGQGLEGSKKDFSFCPFCGQKLK
ncbi:response regulator [Clostridium scatologenes]|uniref:Stage 0 sporulation protein A homolog n=1 Tax=Clostridium scatologenes TaxID=1548 RepID=A0A0E3JRG5_CLOSL|nr:response regulator [Clostridium scatologenes]AKA71704.1 response regulator receiver protein [Clostridium scatologenes]